MVFEYPGDAAARVLLQLLGWVSDIVPYQDKSIELWYDPGGKSVYEGLNAVPYGPGGIFYGLEITQAWAYEAASSIFERQALLDAWYYNAHAG